MPYKITKDFRGCLLFQQVSDGRVMLNRTMAFFIALKIHNLKKQGSRVEGYEDEKHE
jgi:hypothetical protein